KKILEQGIEVIGVYFTIPFLKNEPDYQGEKHLNIPLLYVDLGRDFQEILLNPKFGFGKNINPCIDCRILMFKKAGALMIQEGASFIISGEVLGQRPMSQSKKNLFLISEESGFGKYILRPLSALLLPETEPERCHIVKRGELLDIQGRSRKRQIDLARQWGIENYPSPAGGCKLTEPGYAHRIKDLLIKGKYDFNDLELLKVGRHFNIYKFVKLVVGRNEKENKIILSLASPEDYLLNSPTHKGPVALVRCYNNLAEKNEEIDNILDLASKITTRYCDKEESADLIDINISKNNKIIKKLKQVPSLSEQSIKNYLI
ncbi:MAG TPA: tRNA 4-thiouridine(8) synthase ThiI, partial [Atribacterota bacterium]|nr:tRNA 4-thiouridine(8) synthase ThiI [Atribacterota bacterium]